MVNQDQSTPPANGSGLWRNSTLFRLGLISFFADVASEMLYPITPLFLTMTLGTSMVSVGIIEGFAECVAGVLKTFSGFHSDSIQRRKPFIVLGYLLAAISKPLIGVAQQWNTVLFARGLDRTGKGLRTAPRDAMIADSVPATQRGLAFGWHRSMDTLGAAIGPLVTLAYIESQGLHFRPLYSWALIPGLLAVALALTLRERRGPQEVGANTQRESATHDKENSRRLRKTSALKALWTRPFVHYLVAWSVFALANASDAFILLRAREMNLSISKIILIYCAFNLTYSLLSIPLGALSDRWGRRPLLISGLILFSVLNLGFASATHEWHLWAIYLTYGVFMAATEGVGKALVVDVVPKHLKATGLGVFGTVTGLCTFAASVMTGWLWDQFGSGTAFTYSALGALIAAILFSWRG